MGLGIVPLQDPEVAIEHLSEVRRLGLRGVQVGSNISGVPISDQRYDRFFSAVAAHDLSVFVHAFQPCHAGKFSPRLANAIAFPWEIGYATSAFIARGGSLRIPGLRLAVSHGGGGALSGLGRLSNAWDSFDEVREEMCWHPQDSAASLFYDGLVFEPSVLRLHADLVGADRLMLGSDYPFMRGSLSAIVRCAEFDQLEIAALESETALRWLRSDSL